MATGKTLLLRSLTGGTARQYLLPGQRVKGLSMTERKRLSLQAKRRLRKWLKTQKALKNIIDLSGGLDKKI